MRRFLIYLLVLTSVFIFPTEARPQLIKKAGQLLQTAFDDRKPDTLASVSEEALMEEIKDDSLRLQELSLQLQEMRLNEILLRAELDRERNMNQIADSLKREEERQIIDSLRNVTKGVPVLIEDDTLFMVYAARGGYSAFDRAEMISETLMKIGKERRLTRDSVYMLENDNYIDIMYGNKVIVSITEQDALWQGTTRHKLAERYVPILVAR